MSDTRWIRVTDVANIPLREGREVVIGTRTIAVFNLGDRYLAVDNRCPHKQGPLADGIVTGASVVCPLHAWRVNLETGAVERPTVGVGQCVRAYATRVDDGVICIEMPAGLGPAGAYPYATTTNESAA